TETKESLNFIEQMIEEDIANGKNDGRVHTRFPPEPNGYLHIGHTKALCISFETAQKYGGKTNLRFDDTNPTTEETHYVEAIKKDIKWLGFEWEGEARYASDYFPQLHAFAVDLIKKGLAYVDDLSPEEMATQKGTPTKPGVNSPNRDRSVAENLDLFEQMKKGIHPDGSMVLRAKVDMASPNMLMRDPIMYRIKHEEHHRTGDEWVIYPMYDFTHGQSDSIEEITHSLCSLEFIHHRPLYDWFIKNLGIFPSKQTEFARMNVTYMITSKRKLLKLVQEGLVTGWDDPRMPTISGMRRRGYPPMALREFCKKVGVARRENLIDVKLLENCVRQELNKTANRMMAVLDPVKVVITNYPEDKTEDLILINNPEDESAGKRVMPFSREIYIERADFREDPPSPKKFYRLGPERNVRLKGAYIIRGESFVKDENGVITEIHATYYPDSKSGEDTSGVRARGVLHWVSVPDAKEVEVRNYDRLFTDETPTNHEDKDFLEFFNTESLKTITAYGEPALAKVKAGERFQFMRIGYFCCDSASSGEKMVFNKTVSLKDGFKKKK
ncbi:MAG: glutamine--tRNA ligase/YqeY domain fusion protein, partial [Saprospiraceae bacterium]